MSKVSHILSKRFHKPLGWLQPNFIYRPLRNGNLFRYSLHGLWERNFVLSHMTNLSVKPNKVKIIKNAFFSENITDDLKLGMFYRRTKCYKAWSNNFLGWPWGFCDWLKITFWCFYIEKCLNARVHGNFEDLGVKIVNTVN